MEKQESESHPGCNPEANLKSIPHRCLPILVAFVWELAQETIDLPLGCLQAGQRERTSFAGVTRGGHREDVGLVSEDVRRIHFLRRREPLPPTNPRQSAHPLSSQYATYKTVKARVWP